MHVMKISTPNLYSINAQSKETRNIGRNQEEAVRHENSYQEEGEGEKTVCPPRQAVALLLLLNEQDEKMIEAIGEVAVGGFEGKDTFSISVETAATDERPICIDQISEGTSANVNDTKKYSQSNKKRKSSE
ncbi:uncharacterized protein LOC132742826 isoform X2 [Ruditapes philippinarum]|uniref:uncharacterized protein LOC132742826 isoform X2 n=1 Tax=Ruditapes philippinarum TaxID=129788 RepID=UPI00295BC21D|nr:uncharacterized protein LOC132742826 isoform X2 [Ruditapes philippinarum]